MNPPPDRSEAALPLPAAAAGELPASPPRATNGSWRRIPLVGALFIAVIVALAGFDIYRGHQASVQQIGRELDIQARAIAEQTTRSVQTIDLILHHVAMQQRSGELARLKPDELRAYLHGQAAGLLQIDGLSLFDAEGRLLSTSGDWPTAGIDSLAQLRLESIFARLRGGRGDNTLIGASVRGSPDRRGLIFPVVRRLDTPAGRFAGIVVAHGKVDYFRDFYQQVRIDDGTRITLVHRDGYMLARYPSIEAAVDGQRSLLDQLTAQRNAQPDRPLRFRSPIDGVDRFGALQAAADYPLVAIVARDEATALAPWRNQALGTGLRTLALAVLAGWLLALLQRQLVRLDKARASLELSRERFALAAAGSDMGIWDWDLRDDTVYASPRAREIFGLQPGPGRQSRSDWFAAIQIHPDDAAARSHAIREHMEGHTPVYAGEYRVRGAQGSYRWIRVRGLCVRDASGKALRMAGSVADIDDRQRAEAALRLSEQRYALAMTGSTGGHWVWEIETDALFVSETVNQLFGLPPEFESTTRSAYFAHVEVHPDDLASMAAIDARARRGELSRADFEYRILLPGSGEIRWILTRAQCFRDASGKAVRMAGVSVDITERKQTEQALKLSEERFALAVAGSNDGIIDWDIVNDRMYTSPRTMQMVGVDSDLTVRSRAQWMALLPLHPDDRQRHADDLQRFLAGEETLREGEYRLLMADGHVRWIRVRNLCVRDADGKPLRLAGSVSDIDAYKRVEAALRESEERYALAMTGSNEGHWVWDLATDELYASARLSEMLGVPGGAQVRPYREYFAHVPIHPDDRAEARLALDEHLAGQRPELDIEYRINLPGSGEMRWLHTRAQCFRDADGRPLRLAGSTVDSTRRKRIEESLRQSQERFALAVAGSDDGVWDWDYASGMAFESRRARELQALPLEPEQQPIAELIASLRVHPDDAARRAEAIRAHLAGETAAYECEYRVRHDDGEYRWIRVRALCIRDASGRPCRMAGSVSDIDSRKRAEQALRRSDERFQLAVAGANVGLWDWDLATDSLFLSARAQQLLWLEPGEPQRPRREWIALTPYHPDDVAKVRNAIAEHLRGTSRDFMVEYRVQHHSGAWRWYRQRGLAVRDAQGKATRMAGSMEDITERMNAVAERERLEGQLLQAQKLEAIGTLAGGIAHDFNNILAAILGYGEMAQKDAAEGTPLRRHIDAAMSAGMRAKSLVERILAFSRTGMSERVPVHVESVVREAIDVVAASLPAGIKLEQELHAGDAAVVCDPTQVHQVVLNLCANAVQAMGAAGTLSITLDLMGAGGSRCATSVLADTNHVRLRVRDSGCGIAPRVLERIFDPFFTTKEVGVGTGLGLSLVHGIVTDLGGGIDVQSELGAGSLFTVYLPWQSCIAAPEPVAETKSPNGHGETILLVDDEEALVRLGEEMIAELGYEPIGFTSGLAALASLRADPQRYSAVLSDEAMPEMTGSELVRKIREIRPDIPIVLMSGYVTPALSLRAREAGVAEVLSKPLAANEIARGLADALRG